jgi:hypothetical protein
VLFMNEHEVEETLHDIDPEETPNLAAGAQVLSALVDWANSNSDGWHAWPKPCRAAKNLQQVFQDKGYAIRFGQDRDGSPLEDINAADLNKALRPIKTFLTTQGVNWNADLPWAAVLPAA